MNILAGLFRDPSDIEPRPACRPAPQHKRLTAFLPATLPDLPNEMTRGATIAMSWAAHATELRRKPNQILIRLMDGKHSLWPEADAANPRRGGDIGNPGIPADVSSAKTTRRSYGFG
jgi:hypothetical protein